MTRGGLANAGSGRCYRERVSAPAHPKPSTEPRARIAGVVVVGMSVAVWWPAFTLGAWGDFFFDQMLTVWAASTGALIVVLLQLRGRARVLRALALAIPSLWLALSFLVQPDTEDFGAVVFAALGVL